jgi:GntR family transcriptional regulator
MNENPELVLDGGTPIWQQIEGQIRQLVQSGALHPGEELPTVRAVAVGLAINPQAVEQAYDQLAQAGLVIRGEASGPRVAAPSGDPGHDDLKQLCEVFLREAMRRGHSVAAVFNALHACVEEVRHDQAH